MQSYRKQQQLRYMTQISYENVQDNAFANKNMQLTSLQSNINLGKIDIKVADQI